ncbi:MAG TPA: sigma-70 family RNA polymerase sigma factor [Sedimentisphaerales bacterium]|jgi:RNA polymerase sigma-70 factor (ECF subfamily)|nr:sigma-70 family RNA polymerase sigma factor [Sedimentisphaerales bacterium]HNU27867.1 sigma-70 family RNA polymerase sigma factor [Sedimentisphaerales bacterium]
MGYSDENLIAAHLKGDPTAFRELVRRYGDGVLGYLCHMTGNRDQAEDLFQETFKRVHEKAHTFRGEGFKSWLFTIATRVTIDGARRRKRRVAVSLDQDSDCEESTGSQLATVADENAASPPDELLRQEQKEQVRKAVESLPTGQRATLILAYYQQLSYREVAEALGCSVGAVKTQMSRALATLAQRLPDSIGATK